MRAGALPDVVFILTFVCITILHVIHKMRTIFAWAFSFLLFAAPSFLFSQCQQFAKAKCMPQLKPYLSSGQLYSTTLLQNDKTELTMTFYSGQNYRVAVCSEKALGQVTFKLKDADGNVFFTNKGYGNFWDFNVQNTQELTIEVNTPAADPAVATDKKGVVLDKSGCVAILVGFNINLPIASK